MARSRKADDDHAPSEEPTVVVDSTDGEEDQPADAVREAASLLKDPVTGDRKDADDAAADADQPKAAPNDAAPPAGAPEESTGGKARRKLAAAASDAKERASSAAAASREKASGADVHEIAKTTSGLIDNTRPFFLAGCALLFAMLGFFQGDGGLGQFYVAGAIIFVLGAAFSGEITEFSQRHRRED